MRAENIDAGIGKSPSILLRAAAALTLRDRDLLQDCPAKDRLIVFRDAVLLLLILALTFGVWTLTIATFSHAGPLAAAMIAAVVAGIVYLLDASIAVAGLGVTGPLAAAGKRRFHMPAFVVRLIVAGGLSFATGAALTAVIFQDKLLERRAEELEREYAAVVAAYDHRIAAIRQTAADAAGAVEALRQKHLELKEAEIRRIVALGAAETAAANADVQMRVEKDGIGVQKGQGLRYKAALEAFVAAEASAKAEKAALTHVRDGLADLAAAIAAAKADADAAAERAERDIAAQIRERDARRKAPLTNDILENRVSYEKLSQDRRYGAQVRRTEWTITAVLCLLELAMLLAKFFSPPSTYNLLQLERLARTKAQSDARTQDALTALRRRHAPMLRSLTPPETMAG
ncbi:MAG TPA: DUF4407 domain-containing protein [Azospirillaceae bacterium]|nr:DUF4407 domain-containing protein [Azospirillaceae bacterium]HRQ80885.1 DUF4407 domain-containing protein [Azospirillaceae bacterium]